MMIVQTLLLYVKIILYTKKENEMNKLYFLQGIGFPFVRTPNYCGTIISGEAPESDDGMILYLKI